MKFKEILTPLGTLTLWARSGALVRLDWDGIFSETPDDTEENTEILDAGEQILEAYFSGKHVDFHLLRMNPTGTDFQRKVWNALREIPYGKTVSYAEIARRIGSPQAVRAVGMANHVNPLPIFIPCHRVVGANGNLTGYAPGLGIKRFLLELERGTRRLQYPAK